jgi:PHD/YefM family antitoxin component YafN of YafNO toxin-antitoxin module
MPTDTYVVAPDDLERMRLQPQTREQRLEAALREQMAFLDRIDRAETGWWDKDGMDDAKAAIWNALEPVQ